MISYLFLLTTGPVQSFISQARKLQDLYAGSKLLSDITDAAIDSLPSGSRLIFPHKNITSKPNRLLAVLNLAEGADPGDEGRKIEEKLRDFIRETSKSMLDDSRENIKKDTAELLEKHINEFFEINWVVYRCTGDYVSDFSAVEKLAAANKVQRKFTQSGEAGRKCSLCGERNAYLTDRRNTDKIQLKPEWEKLTDTESSEIKEHNRKITGLYSLLYPGEGLCGVCYLKRRYDNQRFPSVAMVALKNILEHINNTEGLTQKYSELKDLFYSNDFDEQILLSEGADTDLITEFSAHTYTGGELKEINRKLSILKSSAAKHRLKFSPYYATMMLDGDNMGQWLSGGKLHDQARLEDFHIMLSKCLGDFAEKCYELTGKRNASIVYAGGDDLLCFTDINSIFKLLAEIKLTFESMVTAPLQKEFGFTQKFTISGSVVIAHYKTPLHEVLSSLRRFEKTAKANPGKDTVVIAVLKHSGETTRGAIKWPVSENNVTSIDLLNKLLKITDAGTISKSAIKKIIDQTALLLDSPDKKLTSAMIKADISRIIDNSGESVRTAEGKNKFTRDQAKETLNQIYDMCGDVSRSLFPALLSISEFISRYTSGELSDEN